ncbi:MAG: translation elongation factor Ts [Deltaproteobacteria bacterium]|nr:translation elongation factor Ts [Deltaproteobacteria bacterium]
MATLDDIKTLRERTGAGILDCKKALQESGGDLDKAVDWLRAKGLAASAKKAGRIAAEGLVLSYIHGGGRIGVLIEVNCETDFAARTETFQTLVRELGLQIAAHSPEWVSVEDVPAAAVEKERAVQRSRVLEEGKPEAVADRIVEGRLQKWYQEVCLLEQNWFRDESKTIRDLVGEAVGSIGENIKVRRFVRWAVGEGLEKRQDDFASEVAAQAQQART